MTIEDHECEDMQARQTIRDARDEWSEQYGIIIARMNDLVDRMRHLSEFLKAPAYTRQQMNGGHKPSPSFADLVDEVTDHGLRPSHPVRAALYKLTGKLIWRLVFFVAGVGAALGVEQAIKALLKGH